jgi:hypothetical protein
MVSWVKPASPYLLPRKQRRVAWHGGLEEPVLVHNAVDGLVGRCRWYGRDVHLQATPVLLLRRHPQQLALYGPLAPLLGRALGQRRFLLPRAYTRPPFLLNVSVFSVDYVE